MKTLVFLLILALPICAQSRGDFNGSASINGCSGALFILNGMELSQKALLITNGHCIRLKDLNGAPSHYPAPGEFIYSLEGERVRENTYIMLSSDRGTWSILAEKLLFATMTGTDFAVYELRSTYLDLELAFGIKPFLLDSSPFQRGDSVLIHAGVFNRSQACSIAGWAHLREGPYHTNDAIRFSPECSIYQGFSGAPIFRKGLRLFAGLANTHFNSKAEGSPCDLSKPCEVENGLIRVPKDGQSYGISVHQLYDCLEDNKLNFLSLRCPFRPQSSSARTERQIAPGDILEKSLVAIINHRTETCSGIFIAKNLVLTAAHCVIPNFKGASIGQPGDWVLPLSLPEGIDPLRGDKLEIAQTIVHPRKTDLDIILPIGEDRYLFDNPDLAILVLKAPYAPAVPVNISVKSLSSDSQIVFAGFGRGNASWQRPERSFFKMILDYQEISFDYSDLVEGPTFNFIRALEEKFELISNFFYFVKKDSVVEAAICYGDSGGPLLSIDQGQVHIIGVASMFMPHPGKGDQECNGSFLSVFSKVAPHEDWLHDQIKELAE